MYTIVYLHAYICSYSSYTYIQIYLPIYIVKFILIQNIQLLIILTEPWKHICIRKCISSTGAYAIEIFF